MKYLVVIPARGGSKGIPKKNIKLLNGKPLIHYSIEVAQEVFGQHEIFISTNDFDIKKVVESLDIKVPILRPEHLATDTATTQDVLIHVVDYLASNGETYDAIVLLQPTSPFRQKKDIENAIDLYSNDLDMVVSVKETDANPYYVLFEEDENNLLHKSKKGTFTRRQDCPKVWELNGAVYVINIESLMQTPMSEFKKIVKSPMSKENSLDIDDELDWLVAENLIKLNQESHI